MLKKNVRLMWEYKWRLLIEQFFLLMAAAMSLHLSYQLSFWIDLYLGMAIVWYSLRGSVSLIPTLLGGLICLLYQGTLTLASVLTVMITPVMALGIVSILLKCTGPFLPLLDWRQTVLLSGLILAAGLLNQLILMPIQGALDWHGVIGQLTGSLLCLSFFSHWDSHVPQKNTPIARYLVPSSYLSILFFLNIATLATQNTAWFMGCLMTMLAWLFIGQIFLSLLIAFAALIIAQLTLGLIPSLLQWQPVCVGLSWLLVLYQLRKNDCQYQKKAMRL